MESLAFMGMFVIVGYGIYAVGLLLGMDRGRQTTLRMLVRSLDQGDRPTIVTEHERTYYFVTAEEYGILCDAIDSKEE